MGFIALFCYPKLLVLYTCRVILALFASIFLSFLFNLCYAVVLKCAGTDSVVPADRQTDPFSPVIHIYWSFGGFVDSLFVEMRFYGDRLSMFEAWNDRYIGMADVA